MNTRSSMTATLGGRRPCEMATVTTPRELQTCDLRVMSTQGHSPNVPTRPIRLYTPTKIALTVSRCPEYPAPSHRVSVRNLVRKNDPAESASSPPTCPLLRRRSYI